MSLLEVEGLTVGVKGEPFSLLRDVGFTVEPGEIVGLVGESGSGKTMASLAIMGLLPTGIELRAGAVRLEGEDLTGTDGTVDRTASQISMIFQHPRGALNPTMKVGKQVARVLQINQGLDRRAAMDTAVEMLGHVGIPSPARVAKVYPHQLSGGMCQRVMIAMALGCRARLLVADEPTTALDVTVQAQIFDLIRSLVAELGCGVVLISHDLAAVAEMCQRVVVMYGGQVMETAPTDELLHDPHHPYTRYLLDSMTKEVDHRVDDVGANFALKGCRFSHRCPRAFEPCNTMPPPVEVGPGHASACHLHTERHLAAP